MGRKTKKSERFLFQIHADKNRGPNRVTGDPEKAIRYFNTMIHRGWTETMIGRAIHKASGLQFETDSAEDFNEFIQRVVKNVTNKRPH